MGTIASAGQSLYLMHPMMSMTSDIASRKNPAAIWQPNWEAEGTGVSPSGPTDSYLSTLGTPLSEPLLLRWERVIVCLFFLNLCDNYTWCSTSSPACVGFPAQFEAFCGMCFL